MANKTTVAIFAVIVAIVGVCIGLIAVSLRKLQSHEVGIQYDKIAKQLEDTPKTEGLYTGPPGFEFIIFPSVFRTMSFSSITCLNKDGVVINLDVAYQFRANPANLKQLILDFKDYQGYMKVLQAAGVSAIHETCSNFNTSQFQAERGVFQKTLKDKLKDNCVVLSCDITDLQVNNIARPSAYESAVRDKEAAKQNIKVAENNRPKVITQEQTKKKEAEKQAEIILDKARSNARIVENKALAEAEGILDQYAKEAETYKKVKDASGLNLTPEGFISYVSVRTISAAKNPVYIGMKSPSKTSYMNP